MLAAYSLLLGLDSISPTLKTASAATITQAALKPPRTSSADAARKVPSAMALAARRRAPRPATRKQVVMISMAFRFTSPSGSMRVPPLSRPKKKIRARLRVPSGPKTSLTRELVSTQSRK